MSMLFLAANVEALSKHLKAWIGQGAGAGHHVILEFESPAPNIACFDISVSKEPNTVLTQIAGRRDGGDVGLC